MTPKIFYFFFANEYQKYAEYYADFKSVEIIGKKCTKKKLFAKNFRKIEIPDFPAARASPSQVRTCFCNKNLSHRL